MDEITIGLHESFSYRNLRSDPTVNPLDCQTLDLSRKEQTSYANRSQHDDIYKQSSSFHDFNLPYFIVFFENS